VDEHRFHYPGWRVVAACSVGTFFTTIPLTTFSVFLRPVAEHFGWSRQAAASAFGTLAIVAALSAPWLGRLLDRFGARRVILPSLALSGCAVASLALLTSSLWHVRVIFAVIGVATMGASPIASSRAVFSWFDAFRGRAMGIVLAGAAVSSVAAPILAQSLIRSAGWRMAWLAGGCATLAVALPIAILLIRERGVSAAGQRDGRGVAVLDAMRTRVFWTLLLVVFGVTVATNGAGVHMVALLVDRGVAANRAPFAVSSLGAASLVGRLITGWLLDRFDAVRVSIALLVVAAAGVFLLANAHSLAAGMMAAAFIGFGNGGEIDVMPYLLSRHYGLRSLSTLYGFNWTAWGLAGATGAIVLGRAFDSTGSYASTMLELGLVPLVAAALMWTLPATPRAAAPAAAHV